MRKLVRPRRLRQGDTVAVVSLSSGMLGDPAMLHKYELARTRLERDFGLRVRPMPHALAGSEFVWAHPELRARDLMDAFADESVDGVFCAIGGDDAIRMLPYVDLETLRAHPKIFMGYSDTTVNHFMLHRAGLVSFYGPSVLCEFGEYGPCLTTPPGRCGTCFLGIRRGTSCGPAPCGPTNSFPGGRRTSTGGGR